MIKILHMTPPIVNNGVYKYIFQLYKYIDHSRFEFEFLMQNPKALMETVEYQKYHFKIHSFTTTQRENPAKFRQEIIDILSSSFDVLELHTSFWRGFMIEEIAMQVGIPKVIVHSHSSGLDWNDPVERRDMMEKHERFKREFNESLATDFWACSEKAADWLFGENIDRRKIKIIHNAINPIPYRYDPQKAVHIKEALGIKEKFVIGNTCRFEFQKNHEFLILCFAEVLKECEDAVLLLAGEGALQDDMKQFADQLGVSEKVIFLGWRNDIPNLLQAIDVYALPSKFEGLPIVALEAQAAGLRCLVSDTISREVIITKECYPLELSVNTWKEKILQLFHEKYMRSYPIDEFVKAGYDINSYIHTIENLYLGVE